MRTKFFTLLFSGFCLVGTLYGDELLRATGCSALFDNQLQICVEESGTDSLRYELQYCPKKPLPKDGRSRAVAKSITEGSVAPLRVSFEGWTFFSQDPVTLWFYDGLGHCKVYRLVLDGDRPGIHPVDQDGKIEIPIPPALTTWIRAHKSKLTK